MLGAVGVALGDMLLICTYLAMLAAPFVFINAFSKLHDENVPKHDNPIRDDLIIMTYPDPDQLMRETTRLALFDRVIATAKSQSALQLWTNKRAEYLRDQRWKNLSESANASERISSTLTS